MDAKPNLEAARVFHTNHIAHIRTTSAVGKKSKSQIKRLRKKLHKSQNNDTKKLALEIAENQMVQLSQSPSNIADKSGLAQDRACLRPFYAHLDETEKLLFAAGAQLVAEDKINVLTNMSIEQIHHVLSNRKFLVDKCPIIQEISPKSFS